MPILSREISGAPTEMRLEYIELQLVWARKLIANGAHKPHINPILRQAIYYQWERPKCGNYDPSRCWSIDALRYTGVTKRDHRKFLRFDHAIPLSYIVDHLLTDEKSNLEGVLSEYVRGTVITLDEDSRLTRAGLQSKMPEFWNWENGDINARYKAVKIKLKAAPGR